MQPYLIAPFKHGLDTDASPWMLPQDAFTEIINGHIRHNFIEKRKGYQKLGNLTHALSITGATNADPAVFTVSSTSGLSDGDTVQLNYLSGGTWSTLNNAQYTLDNVTGTTFSLIDSSSTDVDGTSLGAFSSGVLGFYPANRVMGIERYFDSSNAKQLLVFDTKRAAIWNGTNELFFPLDTSDIMTGDQTNYICAANWSSTSSSAASTSFRLYFTNGKSNAGGSTDGIRIYDPSISTTATTQFAPTFNTGGVELRGCKLLFAYRYRLVCLFTFEDSNSYPQRARWCQAQKPGTPGSFGDEWDDDTAGYGGFVDAPTGDQIVSAQFIQDQLIVFFTQSVWSLVPTSDPALPFRWQKINNFRACDAIKATEGFDQFVTAVGQRGITSTDGRDTQRWDERIQDFVQDDINQDFFYKVFSKRSFFSRKFWNLYPKGESEECDYALIFDDESRTFSKYKISLNVLGHGDIQKDFSLEDFPNDYDGTGLPVYLNDEIVGDQTLQDYFYNDKADILVGGDTSGVIYQLEVGNEDNDSSYDFILESAAWNPFIQEGGTCQFGYLDLFVETNDSTEAQISFYKDNDENPYSTKQFDCLPNLHEFASISNITKANPGVVTAHDHGLQTGDRIYLYKIRGMFQANGGPYTITRIDDNNFSIGEDTSSFDDYTTGGVITKRPFARGKTMKRVYAGGVGYQHRIKVQTIGSQGSFRIEAFVPHFQKAGNRLI